MNIDSRRSLNSLPHNFSGIFNPEDQCHLGTNDGLIKSWEWLGKKVELLYRNNGEIHALVREDDRVTSVAKANIQGIPPELWKCHENLVAYLKDTYVRLSPYIEGKYSVEVFGRLKGGGLEERRLDRALVDELRIAIEKAKRTVGKDITALVGVTGSGKSTAVNFMLGKTMVYDEDEDCIKVRPGEKEEAPIGHSPVRACTLFAEPYDDLKTGKVFLDCGGFFDTRGVNKDIVVTTSTRLSLEQANHVNLILCFEANLILADRAVHLTKVVELVLGTLLQDYRKHASSFMLMITKPTPKRNGEPYSSTDARAVFNALRNDFEEGSTKKELFEFLCRENGKYICVCDPLVPEARQEINALIHQMIPIKKGDAAFNAAYSANARMLLLEEMCAIALIGKELYTKYFNCADVLSKLDVEMKNLKTSIDDLQVALKELHKGEANLNTATSAISTMIANQQKIVDESTNRTITLDHAIGNLRAQITATERQKQEMASSVIGKEELYWSDLIDTEARKILKEVIIKVVKKKRKWFKKKKKITYKKTVTEIGLNIDRDFCYEGPKIHRIVKDPPNKDYWSDEEKTVNTFSISYNSGEGKPAKATIKIFVLTIDTPSYQANLASLNHDLANLNGRMQNLIREKSECQAEFLRAQAVIQESKQTMDKSGILQKRLDETQKLYGEKERMYRLSKGEQDDILKLIFEEREVLDSDSESDDNDDNNHSSRIRKEGNAIDFVFLRDYLEITNDTGLKNNPVITNFLILEHKFKNR